jgi:signal transduction histidine kinase
MINDVVIYSLGIRGLDLAEIGLVIFTINQSVLIAKYNAEQWTTAEKLTKDLDQLVIERTHDLKIANAQIEESKKATEELNLLLQSLNESMDIESMLDKINHFISKKYSFENYALYKVNPNRNFIQLVAHNLKNSLTQDIIDQIETNPIPIKNARGAHALCYKSRKPHHLNRMRIKGLPEEEKLVINQLEFKSFFMIPLILNNQCIGFLDFSSKLEFGIHKEDLSLYSILGKQLSGILYNAQLFREVEGQRNAKENALLELKETQTALSRAERSASINSMISHLAHEVNNPLNFISTAEMVIQESYKELKDFILGAIPDSEETRNFREKIQKLFEEMESGYKQSKTGTVRIRDTIAEIRAITGVDGLHVENFDAYPLLIQNLELTLEKNQIPESSIQIYINGKPWKESHPIQVTHLSQKYIFSRSIRTLLNNALIFASKSDAPSVHIGISIQNLTNRKFTILSIKSNGMKIDSELLPKLFDLKSQLYYGTEIIGLPIIKELLKTVQSNITLVDDGRKSGWVEFQILLMDNL